LFVFVWKDKAAGGRGSGRSAPVEIRPPGRDTVLCGVAGDSPLVSHAASQLNKVRKAFGNQTLLRQMVQHNTFTDLAFEIKKV
jgi:hypothetical protein